MALASTDSDKTLSTDSQTVAGNLKKLAGSGSGTSTIVAGVAAAFTAIAELALDEKRYKNLQEAAAAMQTSIDTVIDALPKIGHFR